jgi:hypothetical protein
MPVFIFDRRGGVTVVVVVVVVVDFPTTRRLDYNLSNIIVGSIICEDILDKFLGSICIVSVAKQIPVCGSGF